MRAINGWRQTFDEAGRLPPAISAIRQIAWNGLVDEPRRLSSATHHLKSPTVQRLRGRRSRSQHRTPGVAGFYPLDNDTPASQRHTSQESRQLRKSAQAVPAETKHTHETVTPIMAMSKSQSPTQRSRKSGK